MTEHQMPEQLVDGLRFAGPLLKPYVPWTFDLILQRPVGTRISLTVAMSIEPRRFTACGETAQP